MKNLVNNRFDEKDLLQKVNPLELDGYYLTEFKDATENNKYLIAWREFRSKLETNDEIWSWKIGAALHMRRGYCIVRNNEIVAVLQTAMS